MGLLTILKKVEARGCMPALLPPLTPQQVRQKEREMRILMVGLDNAGIIVPPKHHAVYLCHNAAYRQNNGSTQVQRGEHRRDLPDAGLQHKNHGLPGGRRTQQRADAITFEDTCLVL
jgi:hypothetical protein